MIQRRKVFLLIISLLSVGPAAVAAQRGITGTQETPVYGEASLTSNVVERLGPLTEVASSNLPTAGFYKVRTPRGKVGWIPVEWLTLESAKDRTPSTDPTAPGFIKDKELADEARLIQQASAMKWSLSLLAGYNFFSNAKMITDFDRLSPGYSYGGEIVFSLSPRFGFVLRAEKIFNTLLIVDATSSNNFQVDIGAYPLMGGIDSLILKGSVFSVSMTTLVGLASNTTLKISNLSSSPKAISETTANGLSAVGKLNLKWRFASFMTFFAEGGYRYLQSGLQSAPSVPTQASVILRPNFIMDYSGPVAGAGVTFSF